MELFMGIFLEMNMDKYFYSMIKANTCPFIKTNKGMKG